jgi:DNA-directed RNA polymerase alpha subunit
MNISELGLTVRSYKMLERKGILDTDTLLNMTDEQIKDLYDEKKAMAEIIEKLAPLRKERQAK